MLPCVMYGDIPCVWYDGTYMVRAIVLQFLPGQHTTHYLESCPHVSTHHPQPPAIPHLPGDPVPQSPFLGSVSRIAPKIIQPGPGVPPFFEDPVLVGGVWLGAGGRAPCGLYGVEYINLGSCAVFQARPRAMHWRRCFSVTRIPQVYSCGRPVAYIFQTFLA